MDLGQLIECMTEKPAAAMNLPGGKLEEGGEADFVLFDPDRQWEVDPNRFRSRSRNSSFSGETLTGSVIATFLRGRLTYRGEGASV
jgi:dihydroorotase